MLKLKGNEKRRMDNKVFLKLCLIFLLFFLLLPVTFTSAVKAKPFLGKTKTVHHISKCLHNIQCSENSRRSQEVAQRKFRKFYLESICQREQDNNAAQFELLRHALKYSPNAPEALFDLAGLEASNPVYAEEDVNRLYQRAIVLCPNNKQFRWEYAKYEITVGKIDSAIVLLQALTKDTLKRYDAYSVLASIYEKENENDLLIRTLNEWSNCDENDENISMMKVRTYTKMHCYKEALAIVDTLCQKYPQSEYYPILKAETYLAKGDTIKAWEQNQTVMSAIPDNHYAQLFLVHYYQTCEDNEKMTKQIECVILNPKQNMDVRSSFFQSYISTYKGGTGDKRIDSIFIKLLDQPMDDKALMEVYTAYLMEKNAPDSAYASVMKKILEIDPADKQSRLREVWSLFKKKQYGEVVTACEEGLKYNPDQLLFYVISGNSYMILKQKDKALKIFEAGRNCVPKTRDKEVVSDYYSAFGDLMHEAGRVRESYSLYDSSLVYNASNVSTLNNYAYFLAVSDSQLDKADKMAALAVKYAPNEATFLDTYAWVLFMKGDYKQAKIYIEGALNNLKVPTSMDTSLYEHAGDIYSQLGNTEEALKAWKHAYKLNGKSKILKKKIKLKKYIKQ